MVTVKQRGHNLVQGDTTNGCGAAWLVHGSITDGHNAAEGA